MAPRRASAQVASSSEVGEQAASGLAGRAGHRDEEGDVEVVAGLRCLHDLGLDLRTSAELARLGCGLDSPPGSEDRGAVVRAIDEQLDAITSRRRELDAMAATLDDLRGQLASDGA